jgi:hypothetical protein
MRDLYWSYSARIHEDYAHPQQAARPIPNPVEPVSLLKIGLNLLLITGLYFVNLWETVGNAIFCAALIIMVMCSGNNVIKVLILWCFILFANGYLIHKGILLSYLKFVILFLCGLRVAFDAYRKNLSLKNISYLYALLAFGLCCSLLAFVNDYMLEVSLLKIGSFIYGAGTLLLAGRVYKQSGKSLVEWILAIAIFFIAVNILSYGMGIANVYVKGVDEVVAPTGIPGATSHPQTLGTISSTLATFCFGLYLFAPYRLRWLSGGLSLVMLFICYLSAARTGLFAAVLSMGMAGVLAIAITVRKPRHKLYYVGLSSLQLVLIGGLFAIFTLFYDAYRDGDISRQVIGFILKSGRHSGMDTVTVDNVFASREALIAFSWDNFMNQPLTGIGFGISYSGGFAERATLFSAPTEKGFLPTAILEETGIIGTALFLLFIYMLARHFWRSGNLFAMLLLTVVLLINMGEMVMFSFGGLGMFLWSMVAACMVIGDIYASRELVMGSYNQWIENNHQVIE